MSEKIIRVKDLFAEEKIDINFIKLKFEGDYWANCDRFIRRKWNGRADFLTERESVWVKNILADCTEKRIEG